MIKKHCWQCIKHVLVMMWHFQYQQAKNRARRSTMDQKTDNFCQIDIRDLAILGVEKVVLWIFSKFFRVVWKVLGIVLDLWGQFLRVFSASKVDKWPQKSKLSVKNMLIFAVLRVHFGPFWWWKKSFSGLSRLFWSCLGSVWATFLVLKGLFSLLRGSAKP